MDAANIGDIIAGHMANPLCEQITPCHCQECLERLFEPFTAPNQKIETLSDNRDEIEPELAGNGHQTEGGICLTFLDSECRISLGTCGML